MATLTGGIGGVEGPWTGAGTGQTLLGKVVTSTRQAVQTVVPSVPTMGGYGVPAGREPAVLEAGVGALIPSVLKVVPKVVTKVAPYVAGAAAALGITEATGGGITPSVTPGPGGVPLVGPGLAEPPAEYVVKEWNTGTAQFYMLADGRIMVYSKKKRRWKIYRPAKHIVVPRNPRIGTLLRADKRTDNLIQRLARRAGVHKRGGGRSRPRFVSQGKLVRQL